MKRNRVVTILAILLALLYISGCAKKTTLKEERVGAREPATVAPVKEVKKGKAAPAGETAESRRLKEQALKEQAEKAARAAEERKRAAEKTKVAPSPARDLYELVDIRFDFDKFALREEARETLKKHADWLSRNRSVSIVIEGHCDERGTAEYNLALGERRAKAAAKYLVDLGVEANRIKTISYGKELPLDPGHNEEAWAKNRRAHFVSSMKN